MSEQTANNLAVPTRKLSSAIEDLDLSRNTHRSTALLGNESVTRLQLVVGLKVTRINKSNASFVPHLATTLLLSLTKFFKLLQNDLSTLAPTVATTEKLKGHKDAVEDYIADLSPKLSKVRSDVDYIFVMVVYYRTSKIKRYVFTLIEEGSRERKVAIFNETVDIKD